MLGKVGKGNSMRKLENGDRNALNHENYIFNTKIADFPIGKIKSNTSLTFLEALAQDLGKIDSDSWILKSNR